MIKCIYKAHELDREHCDRPADYIYLGKSYCFEHMEIRGNEQREKEFERKNKTYPTVEMG